MKDFFLLFFISIVWYFLFEKKRRGNTKKFSLPQDVVNKKENKIDTLSKNETISTPPSSSLQKCYKKQHLKQKHSISSKSHITLKKELLINKYTIRKCIIIGAILRKKY